jgi:hypothetical protein
MHIARIVCVALAGMIVAGCGSSSTTLEGRGGEQDSGPQDSGRSEDAASDAESGRTVDAGTSGTIVSGSFVASNATFRSSRSLEGNAMLDIVLADAPEMCAASRPALSRSLQVTIRAAGQMAPGLFPIVVDTFVGGSGPAPQGTAIVWTIRDVGVDACVLDNLATDNPITGTVRVTSYAEDTLVQGTVDLHGPNGSQITGSFRAGVCPQIDAESYACELIPPNR